MATSSMASLCLKNPSFSKTQKTQFTPPLPHPLLTLKPRKSNPPKSLIASALIEPDGGKLVNLIVPEPEKALKTEKASGIPEIRLSKINLEWVHVLSEGWASPLSGFMRESEFLQTLHFNCLRLPGGGFVNMSVPIVLDIDDAHKERIGNATSVALVDAQHRPIAILNE